MLFYDDRAFRWDDAFADDAPHSPDRAYVAEDSAWLANHETVMKTHRHFVLGFNAIGQRLEVIASGMRSGLF